MAKNNPVEEGMDKIANAGSRRKTVTKTFSVNGVKKTGNFTFKIPSIMERVGIGVKRAKMLDGAQSQSMDKFSDDLAFMVAYLDTVLEERPKWFNFEQLDTVAELNNLFWEASSFINSFQREPITGEDGGHGQPTANAETVAGDEDI